ncbi:MAG: hypothetical protein AAF288_10890 [Planctomycetota bacterium]
MKLTLADPDDAQKMRLSRSETGLVLASPIGFLLGMMALVFPAWSRFAGVLLPWRRPATVTLCVV